MLPSAAVISHVQQSKETIYRVPCVKYAEGMLVRYINAALPV